jgi:hypothetical protein
MEEFFTKVLNYSIKKCEKLLPLLIDFDLKHCIKTEAFKNSITGKSPQEKGCSFHLLSFNGKLF